MFLQLSTAEARKHSMKTRETNRKWQIETLRSTLRVFFVFSWKATLEMDGLICGMEFHKSDCRVSVCNGISRQRRQLMN